MPPRKKQDLKQPAVENRACIRPWTGARESIPPTGPSLGHDHSAGLLAELAEAPAEPGDFARFSAKRTDRIEPS